MFTTLELVQAGGSDVMYGDVGSEQRDPVNAPIQLVASLLAHSHLAMQAAWKVWLQLKITWSEVPSSSMQMLQQPVTSPRSKASVSTPTHSSSVSFLGGSGASPATT